MWIKATAQLSENIYQLVTPATSHCLMCGDKIAIIDSGITALREQLLRELGSMLGDDRVLDYIFLTHCHFDHLGGVPVLRKTFPEIKLFASPLAAEMLKDRKLLSDLYHRNKECAEAFSTEMIFTEQEWCAGFCVDRVVGDGDTIELGEGVIVKVMSCPGHSKEQVSYYVPSDSALAGGEAFGFYNGRDKNFPTFDSSYKDYIESLEKAARLDVKVLSFPHNGALTGNLAQKYLITARLEAESFYTSIKERLANGELIEEIAGAILPDWRVETVCPEGPFFKEQEKSLTSLVKAIAAN